MLSPSKARTSTMRPPKLPLLVLGNPACGDDVRALSAIAAECGDLLLERGPPLPRDGAAVVESLRRDVAADIRRQRVSRMRGFPALEWHLDEM